jgi:hypothetical protein
MMDHIVFGFFKTQAWHVITHGDPLAKAHGVRS